MFYLNLKYLKAPLHRSPEEIILYIYRLSTAFLYALKVFTPILYIMAAFPTLCGLKFRKLIISTYVSQSRSSKLMVAGLIIHEIVIQDRKLTKAEEQKVILAAKNLYTKLQAEREKIMVVDWYKDEQPRKMVFILIQKSLNNDLPDSYDRIAFNDKANLLFNHIVDMAVQGYGWA